MLPVEPGTCWGGGREGGRQARGGLPGGWAAGNLGGLVAAAAAPGVLLFLLLPLRLRLLLPRRGGSDLIPPPGARPPACPARPAPRAEDGLSTAPPPGRRRETRTGGPGGRSSSRLFLLLLLLLLLCGRRLPRLGGSLPAGGKAVLITGCDKGFGYAAARHLHAQGFTVFAGCLLGDHGGSPGARELASLESGRLHVLQLDVSSEEEVGRALRRVEETLAEPEQGLWGLVNNAGVASFGDVEFTSMQKYQAVAAVNLWGTIRVTKAFLPLIRRARGRVVNVASMLGRMAAPLRSSYCISKYGVEAFTDCLRQEMYRWGVGVVAIEPSNFIAATGILTQEGVEAEALEMWRGASEEVRVDYGEDYLLRQASQMKAFVRSGLPDVGLVLNDITDALTARHPYARYNPMEAKWWVRLQAMTHLPTMLADWLYFK
ncbi:D-beta-hydroxybutyrate dehydrogenase, mitochondrial-like [Hemicordylus capensis]|uniref:D-beta-hydroxybutyrate dehydrogenase, mitochondrial-like n=1 Tax=Hemicordylus capensis TaxID=884348 RepID=UPI0023026161|nr:D-beta-hydroxybutyrate dehydrogenase, mitochondrial-like [Hemicordylus capensis]